MNLEKRFLMGVASGAGSVAVKTLLNILLIPVMLAFLGVEEYGLYVLLLGIGEMSFILDMGFTSALVKALGAYRTSASDATKALEFLKVGHMLYGTMAVLTLTAGLWLLPVLIAHVHMPPSLVEIARHAFVIVLFECALMLYTNYYKAVLTAHCLNQWANLADTVFAILSSMAGLLLLLSGHGLVMIMAVRLGAAVIRAGLLLYHATRVEPCVVLPKAGITMASLREIAGLSFHAMLINISVFISHKIDHFVIALFLPIQMVGYYEIVFRFLGLAQQVTSKMCEGVFPMFTRMLAMGRTDQVRHLFLRVSHGLHVTVCILLLFIITFYPDLFRFFSAGKIPMAETLPVLALAAPTVWTGVLQIPAGHFLFASGRQTYLSVSSILAAVSNLILSLILVQHLGLVGVALGTLIPQFIQHQFSLIYETCRDLGISFAEYAGTVHLKALPPLLAVFLGVQAVRHLLGPGETSLAVLVLTGGLTCLAGCILWLWLAAEPAEKTYIITKVVLPIRSKWFQHAGVHHG